MWPSRGDMGVSSLQPLGKAAPGACRPWASSGLWEQGDPRAQGRHPWGERNNWQNRPRASLCCIVLMEAFLERLQELQGRDLLSHLMVVLTSHGYLCTGNITPDGW